MYLRFKIIDRDNNGIELADYTMSIDFENNPILLNNSNDVNALLSSLELDPNTIATQLVTNNSFNGRFINTSLELGNYIKLNIPFDNLLEEGNLRIRLYDLDSVLVFDKSYKIFGYDLGNNANIGIDTNPPFTIRLVTQFDADYNEDYSTDYYGGGEFVVSNFVAYRKPYTNEIWYFDSNNSEGERKYYGIDENGNEVYIGDSNGFFCYDGNLSMKQTIELNRYEIIVQGCITTRVLLEGYPLIDTSIQRYNGISTLDLPNYRIDNINNRLLRSYNWIPNSQLNFNCLAHECVVLENETTSALTFNFSDIPILNINDQVEYPYTNYVINYKLIDREGCLEQSKNVNEELNYPFVFQVTDDNNFKFITKNTGDYILYAEFSLYWNGLKIIECKKKRELVGKYWFEVQEKECGELELKNLSFDTISVEVNLMNDDSEFELVNTLQLTQLSKFDFVLNEDGIYSFVFSKGNTSYTYVYTNYCNVRKCLEPIIIDLMCKDNEICKESDYYSFISLMTVLYTHLMLVNEEHSLNYAYTVLTPTKIQDLFKIKETLNRLQEYCGKCSPKLKVSKTSNCGCNGK